MAVVRGVTPTSTGTQDWTHADITSWTSAIFIVSGATSDGSVTTTARMSYGMVDSAGRQGCLGNRVEHNRATTTHANVEASSDLDPLGRCLVILNPTLNNTAGEASFHTALANGVRINWDTAPSSAFTVTCILFGGTTNARVGNASGTGAGTVVNIGYRPDVAIVISGSFSVSSPSTTNNDCYPSLGFAVDDGSDTQKSIYGNWDNLVPTTDADAIVSTTRVGGDIVGSTGVNNSLALAFSATGFTMTAASGSPDFIYLALEFSAVTVFKTAIETLPSGTGTQAFTGLGVGPYLVLGGANLLTTEDSVVDGAGASTFAAFAFTPTVYGAASLSAQEGLALGTSVANSYSAAKALALLNHTGTVAVEAAFSSIDPTGFTLNFTTATAGRMVVLGIQQPQAIRVLPETVQVDDSRVLLLATKAVTSETVLVTDGALMLEQAAVSLEESPRGLISSGGVARGDIVAGGAARGLIVSSPS